MRESPATVLQAPEKVMKAVSASASRYAMIHQLLRDAIVNGTARHGLVLLEAPLAELFGTSRVPVRKALNLLLEAERPMIYAGGGVVLAASYEAKAFGVRGGMQIGRAHV